MQHWSANLTLSLTMDIRLACKVESAILHQLQSAPVRPKDSRSAVDSKKRATTREQSRSRYTS
ncbi:hypothetical protein B0H17DRAFT_1069460 [Mycena rosella]|uniref:Uncharacterized protein n=1 Tax=Mycena rosella TaxID=1033263 RepID=A0AAD7GEY3_MYCRO|nr:hypothetical protein B0H17DRAFT_1069460 [Mycena rosella]